MRRKLISRIQALRKTLSRQSRGKRIKPSDKNLLYVYALVRLSPIFLLVLFLFHGKRILETDWRFFQFHTVQISFLYMLVSFLTAAVVCLVLTRVYSYYHRDKMKALLHRQKLARMLIENKWYLASTKQQEGFFKDLSSKGKSRERIERFPKVFYKMEHGLIQISVEIDMGTYQESLLRLEKKLETGLYCELIDKVLEESFVRYTLLYDLISDRISISDVAVNNGTMRLMKNVYWEFDEHPHMLISGGTGGGKTYFLLTIIAALSETKSSLYILDPKNSDLADLKGILPDVYSKKDDMISCLNQFYENMMERNNSIKDLPAYKTGKNYAYMGLPANFLVFDEYVAFMEMIGRESVEVMSKLKQIVMLGRQSGYFLILACQRPDAKYLGDGIRDQFHWRAALGRMSELGYSMMFGECQKDFFSKPIKGRGYLDDGSSVIREFYTPLVPKEYDFLEEIRKAYKERDMGNNLQKKLQE